jgi:hypothetical protein
MRVSIRVFLLFLSIVAASGQAGSAGSANAGPPAATPFIVIGFVGGFIKHDNLVHSGVQLAAHLREDYISGVEAEVFENHRGEDAHQDILRLLDTNHDGVLSAEEKRNARIIIYGHSWGGSETVTLARKLERDGVPVLLTIQVDSVAKFHEDDNVIPANVAQAANFYQANGLLHGQHQIRAASPSRTQILGNFRFDYDANPVRCAGYPWFARVFENPHIEIECDPSVFSRVESLIRSKLPAANPTLSAK